MVNNGVDKAFEDRCTYNDPEEIEIFGPDGKRKNVRRGDRMERDSVSRRRAGGEEKT